MTKLNTKEAKRTRRELTYIAKDAAAAKRALREGNMNELLAFIASIETAMQFIRTDLPKTAEAVEAAEEIAAERAFDEMDEKPY